MQWNKADVGSVQYPIPLFRPLPSRKKRYILKMDYRFVTSWSRGDIRAPLSCILLMLVLSLGPLLSLLPATCADPASEETVVLKTLDGQEYSYELGLGEKAGFIWVLENRNLTISYDVEVEASASIGKWDVKVAEENFIIRPGTDRLIEVAASSTEGDDGDSSSILLKVALVEIGTGITTYLNGTATVTLDIEVEKGVTILFWHVDLPSALDNPWGRFVILLLIWSVLVYVLTVAIIDGVLRKAVKGTRTKADDIILDIVRMPIIFLLIGYGMVNTLGVLEVPKEWIGEISKWFVVVTILVVAYVIYKVIKDVLIYYGDHHAKRTGSQTAKMLIPLVNNLITVVIAIGTVSFILSHLGYDITVAVAGLGIMGLVIAFAAQDTLSNFFSGLHMLVDQPFQKGDLIILETGEMCEIREIGFRSARLYDVADHVLITLPNNKLANSKIVNITAPDYSYRLKLDISVAYGSDIELVKKTLLDIAGANKDIMHDEKHKSTMRFRHFGDSQLDMQLVVWIEDIRKETFFIMNRVKSDLNESIDQAFREKDIKIPFPQREVWVSSMPEHGPGPGRT